MSHPQPPQRQPTNNETARYLNALHNTALVTLVACPILALLPPRKLDFFTFGLCGTTLFSANYLLRERTGRGILQHTGIASTPQQQHDQPIAVPATEQANLQRELQHAREEMQRLGKESSKPSITEELRQQREAWKRQQQKEVQEKVEEGKGFGEMMMDQIWEVVNWGKKKDDEDD